MYANGQGVKQDYGQARQWYQKAADQGNADARKALDKLSNGKTATPSKGNATASENEALAQAGIPPIPTRDDVWLLIGNFLYAAPSTLVRTVRPNGFKMWMKLEMPMISGVVYFYSQYDCGREAFRLLASKGKDFSGENFEIKTELWIDANKEVDRKIVLNYCN